MQKLLTLSVLLAAAPAYAQFEGVIEMSMQGGDGQHEVKGTSTVIIGKGGMRMQMQMDMGGGPGMQMVTVHNFKEPTLVYQLNEQAKTYSVMDTSKFKQGDADKKRKYTVKKIGTEKVLGYSCTHVQVSDEGGNQAFDLWTTKDVGVSNWEKYMSMGNRGGGGACQQRHTNGSHYSLLDGPALAVGVLGRQVNKQEKGQHLGFWPRGRPVMVGNRRFRIARAPCSLQSRRPVDRGRPTP